MWTSSCSCSRQQLDWFQDPRPFAGPLTKPGPFQGHQLLPREQTNGILVKLKKK
jgi:hypothetical protein